jgi:putative holliday junction resolvase
MSATHNVIGLDVGGRRIGVAVASVEARLATPLVTIDRKDIPDIFPRLVKLLEEQSAEAVVVGLPRGMNGQETEQTAIARQFARELEKACKLPVYLQDEAATSIVAEERLKESRKPYEKGDIDKLAAAYILEDWLLRPVAEQQS